MNQFNEYVGSLLRELREDRNMKQQDIANAFHKDKSLISYWETGKRQMNVIDLMTYLDILKVTDEERYEIVKKIVKYKNNQ